MDHNVIAIVISSILLAVLIYAEVKRVQKINIFWRILASVVAVVCLLFMLIPIRYSEEVSVSNEISIITRGTHPDTIQKLKGKFYTADSILHRQYASKKLIYISDLSYFINQNPEFGAVNLYGYGLPLDELEKLKDHKVNYHPSTAPDGFIAVSWNQRIKSSEQLMLQGIYRNSKNGQVKLLLRGFGMNLDSLIVNTGRQTKFSFFTKPKQLGKAVYELMALSGGDTLYREHIPLETEQAKPLQIVVLASYPDFEYKFLKNWLFEEGFSLMIRTKISKDKYSAEYLNMEDKPATLNAQVFRKADIVIVDEDKLASLSVSEYAMLRSAVKEGLGLIIRKNTVGDSGVRLSRSKPNSYEIADTSTLQLHLVLKGEDYKFDPLTLNQRMFMKPSTKDQVIISDRSGKILVNKTLDGMGSVLNTSLLSTYNWMLSDQPMSYHKYWSVILSSASRNLKSSTSVEIYPRFAKAGEKTRFIIQQGDGSTPNIIINDLKESPRQNMIFPFEWDVLSWQGKLGWNTLKVNSEPTPFYVYGDNDWITLKDHATIESTRRFLSGLNNTQKGTSQKKQQEKQVSLWIFLVGFLISAGYLWLEPRILPKNTN